MKHALIILLIIGFLALAAYSLRGESNHLCRDSVRAPTCEDK